MIYFKSYGILTFVGVIPDVCGLTVNSKHILFLTRNQPEAKYIQTDAAEPYSNLGELIRVCDLDRNYPESQYMYMPLQFFSFFVLI